MGWFGPMPRNSVHVRRELSLRLTTGRTIGEVMRTDLPVIRHNARLPDVLDAVVSTRLNRALVVDDEWRVVGSVSDAELLRRLSPEDHPSIVRILMSRLPFIHLSQEERDNLFLWWFISYGGSSRAAS